MQGWKEQVIDRHGFAHVSLLHAEVRIFPLIAPVKSGCHPLAREGEKTASFAAQYPFESALCAQR
jgi:hypothetical protein